MTNRDSTVQSLAPTGRQRGQHVHAAIDDAVDRMRFGTILLTIHDGRVVQLDVTERQRFA